MKRSRLRLASRSVPNALGKALSIFRELDSEERADDVEAFIAA
jgi:hypothetical protein